ncbi:glycosyltransferase family 2 protein [Candidatus Nitrosotenuis aquarius]|uniref:glycosyltransferase family 2 protein n=1 Tax=Candidatus Nitrosotenuis aquarius TaxID=1846278 RepID=UPI0013C3156F|nr:glycosyltransferase [Candidatus Nitrosotenuis aquarius]
MRLDQKSIRYENQWFHESCFKQKLDTIPKKPIPQKQTSLPKPNVYRATIVSEKTYSIQKKREPKFVIQTVSIGSSIPKSMSPSTSEPIPKAQTPETSTPKQVKTKSTRKKKARADPVLVVLAIAIFALLFFTAYSMFSYLSYVAIGIAAVLSFYQILSRREPSSQYKYKTRTASFYSIVVMVLPFVLGGLMLYDGYTGTMSIIQVLFVWMLTLSFWQTMLFVPLAIRSIAKESLIEEPPVYPRMSVIVPAYNEERVIRTTIEALIDADYPDKEIIVVDDGSKDRTLAIAMEYKDRVKVLHKENGGKASALNMALLYSTGDIVVIVDADTICSRSGLKYLARSMADENVVAVAGNVKIRNKMNWITWCQALEYLSGIQIMRRGLDYFGAIYIVPGALGAFRKTKLLEAGTYHKDTLVEDFDATVKVLRSGMIVEGSNKSIAYTQAPQTFVDFYKQRKRWYRGNLQILRRHSDILTNPRFGYLHSFAFPLMVIHMILIPITSIMVWGFAIYQLLIGNYYFVAFTVSMFVTLQYLLSAMAIRMDGDDKRMILYSVFLVMGYKQIIDFMQLRAAFEELLGLKAKWTSAKRVHQ